MLPPTRALRLALGALAATSLVLSACGHDTKPELRPSYTIIKPTDGAKLQSADDEDATSPGMQVTVQVQVANISNHATLSLLLDGSQLAQETQALSAAGTVSFDKVTIPGGKHTLNAKLVDLGSNKTGQGAAVTVEVESTSGCTFVSPTNNSTLTSATTDVKVTCQGLPANTTTELDVAAPPEFGNQALPKVNAASAADGSVTFTGVTLFEGRNVLQFKDPSGSYIAKASVTVDTGHCPVYLTDPGNVIYNAAGGTPTDPNEHRAVVADLDSTNAGIQANFGGYVDLSVCPSPTATLLFNGNDSNAAATIDPTTGQITFTRATLPDGDPVTEVIRVASSARSGDSLPNSYGVDSVIPQLTITQPNKTTLGAADDLDPGTGGLQTHVAIHATAGVDAASTLGQLQVNGTNVASIPAAVLATDANGDFQFANPLTLQNGSNTIAVKATRKLGNVGSASFTTVVQLGTGPTISVISPASTHIICSHAPTNTVDEVPSTQNCELTMTVAVDATTTTVTFIDPQGTPHTVAVSNGQASFQYSLDQGLGQVITATASDGTTSASTSPITVDVDTIAPVLAWVDPSPDGGAPVLISSQTVSVTLSTDAPDGQVVNIVSSISNGGPLTPKPVVANGTAAGTVGTLTQGQQLLSATVTDDFGNVSAPAVVSVDVEPTGCAITFTNPATSTVTLNASTGRGLTITGNTPTPGCGNQAITFYANPPGGPLQQVAAGTTQANGDFSLSYTFPDQAQTVFTAGMTANGGSNSASFTAVVDTIAPTVSLASPSADATQHLYIVAASGNLNVAAGTVGYAADTDVNVAGAQALFTITVGDAADATGSGGTGTLLIKQSGTTLATVSVTNNATVTLAAPTDIPVLTLAEGPGTLDLVVTDAAGNTTTASFPLRVKSIPPAQPQLVTTDPGNGSYTHVTNVRHADFQVVATEAADPQGDTLTYQVGYSLPFIRGPQPLDDGNFGNASVTTVVDEGSFAGAGVPTSASFTSMPPLNVYSVAARAEDSVGNVSAISPVALVDTRFPDTSLAYAGAAGSNASFGANLELGDIDGDGISDIAALALEGANAAGSIEIVYGGASFSRTQLLQGSAGSFFGEPMAVGDINGDGRADLVAYDTDHLAVYLSQGASGLPATPSFTIGGAEAGSVYTMRIVPDLTGDGIADLVLGNPAYPDAFPGGANEFGRVYVIRGRSTASWSAALSGGVFNISLADSMITGSTPHGKLGNDVGKGSIGLADVDGDGKNELLVPEYGAARVYLFTGATLASRAQSTTTADASTILTSAAETPASQYGRTLGTYDVTGDGRPDVLVADTGNPSHVFAYATSGSSVLADASAPAWYAGSTSVAGAIATGDLNLDGRPDLVFGRGTTNNTEALFIFYGRAGGIPPGTRQDASYYGDNFFGTDFAIADVTGDGQADLIVGAPSNGNGTVEVLH